jgi:transmembrane sensor
MNETLPSFIMLEQEAARWLASMDRAELIDDGDIDIDVLTQNNEEFATWLSQSDSHRVAFLQIVHTWNMAEQLNSMPREDGITPQVANNNFAKVRNIAAIAASVMILVFSVSLFVGKEPTNIYHTAIGSRQVVTLKDGSIVELNSNTKLTVLFSESERLITLAKGEAFFDVSRDENRPFKVITDDQVITVLGTKFSVRRYNEGIEVAVIEGKVQIDQIVNDDDSDTAFVTTGGIASTTKNKISITQEVPEQVIRELSWRQEMIIFESATLEEAAAEFNRYNKQQIVFTDSSVAKLRISGQFQTKNYEAFLRLMSTGYGLKISHSVDSKTIEISE